MGVVESKKDGVIKKFELKVDMKAQLRTELLQLTNWSFAEIKRLYDAYARRTDCPYVDFFAFHKMMPFSNDLSKTIFEAFAEGERYVNVLELICILILTAHNLFRKKLQLLFVIFDFSHQDCLHNRELILIFQSIVNGFCRMTNQQRPKYDYLSRYTTERFVRGSTLQALEKVVTYRRLIEEVEGNSDAFELFRRFNQEIYGYFTQESYLFRVGQYKKYENQDLDRIYRIVRKVNLEGNFEEVELEEKNRRFRLENRKIQCIKHLLEEKEQRLKQTPFTLIRSNSLVLTKSGSLSKVLPPIQSKQQLTSRPKLTSTPSPYDSPIGPSSQPASYSPHRSRRVLFLNGKITSKQDIFSTINYFKSLSGNRGQIRPKEFVAGFEKKAFLKKQVSSLFKHFDRRKRGEVTLEDFLKVYYEGITAADLEVIKQWCLEYRSIHEADNFDLTDFNRKKQKKQGVELPPSTLTRMDEIFASIDRGRKGFLTLDDLKVAYNTGFSIKELEQMVERFGKGGKIMKAGFIRMTLPEEWTIEGTDYVGV